MSQNLHEQDGANWQADIARRTGLTFAGSRGPHLARILEEALEAQPDPTVGLPDHRLDDEATFDRLCDALTVQESFFFREATRLALIREHVLPWAREYRPHLRAWSAGCACGEEAYTLSMMLADAGLGSRYQVLGTDLSARAVASARRGNYSRWAVRGLDEDTVASHFDVGPSGLRVADRFRSKVAFEQHNLLDPLPSVWGKFDLILCRNVLIYFTPEAVRRAAEALTAALAPAGWLLLGVSDPPLDGIAGLERVATARGSAYRRQDPSPGPARDTEILTLAEAFDLPPAKTGALQTTVPLPAPSVTPTAAPPEVSATAGKSEPLELAAAAEEALALADTELAVTLARQALDSASREAAVHRLLIQALAEDGRTRDSLEAASRAVTMFPEDASIREVQAVVLLETGQVAPAMVAARQAAYLDPRSALAHVVLARAHELLGDLEAARRARRNGRISGVARVHT